MNVEIKKLANEIGAMFQSAAQLGISRYRPIANHILSEKLTDPNEIEYILDSMLDYCYDSEMLLMYKSICRRLIKKYPELVYNAIMNYKNVWNSEEGDSE